MMDDDFVEVTNKLPYSEIKQINILQVRLQDLQFKITVRCELDGGSNEKQVLTRSWSDLEWLMQNILNNKKTYLIPKLNSQTYFSQLFQRVSLQQGQRNQLEQQLSERMVQRALIMVCQLILPHLKSLGKQYVQPVFIFFHRNFGLYKNPIYYKEETTPIKQKVGNFFWQTLNKLTTKTTGWQDIEDSKLSINTEMKHFDHIRTRLEEYATLLARLQDEFMGERESIRKQLAIVQKLLLAYEIQVGYLRLIVQEVEKALVRVENRGIVEPLMKQYAVLLQGEVIKSQKKGKELVKSFVQVMCQQEQRIKITPH